MRREHNRLPKDRPIQNRIRNSLFEAWHVCGTAYLPPSNCTMIRASDGQWLKGAMKLRATSSHNRLSSRGRLHLPRGPSTADAMCREIFVVVSDAICSLPLVPGLSQRTIACQDCTCDSTPTSWRTISLVRPLADAICEKHRGRSPGSFQMSQMRKCSIPLVSGIADQCEAMDRSRSANVHPEAHTGRTM
jgi:hypothetical protein